MGRKESNQTNKTSMCNFKSFFLFLNQNICCGYSKEISQREGSFEHPKHILNHNYKPRVLFVGHRQTVQNAASDQGLHCLLTEYSINFRIEMKIPLNAPKI